jgi:hypothetical protein
VALAVGAVVALAVGVVVGVDDTAVVGAAVARDDALGLAELLQPAISIAPITMVRPRNRRVPPDTCVVLVA